MDNLISELASAIATAEGFFVLTLRVNVNGAQVGTFTIPLATTPDSVVSFNIFTTPTLPDKSVLTWDVLTWDVLASDGQMDGAGIASFTVLWTPSVEFEADGVASVSWNVA